MCVCDAPCTHRKEACGPGRNRFLAAPLKPLLERVLFLFVDSSGERTVVLFMQDALVALTRYWNNLGCILVQPMNTEVGAGTLNSATFLRVLGPEPWRAAYVEPSVRPDDARYGENPNRVQTHTQFQVILKPEPGNPQDLYLGSLEALGIDLTAHDIRFVEDNWASPALGAWGLGWEVWLNGLEITQFTYFQQAGGIALDPVSVEITYGMERILMALQGVSHFKDIAYAPGISYGEAFGQAEYEMSCYYLDEADIPGNQRLFEFHAQEAQRMVDRRLSVPAHVHVLKCSHIFNVLDARGTVSTTERARSFALMRALAHEAAVLWVERRGELGHPLGTVPETAPAALPGTPTGSPAATPTEQEAAGGVPSAALTGPASLAFEIGVEELPPGEVSRTAAALRAGLKEKLAQTRLAHGPISVWATPRRVIALVEDVAAREEDTDLIVRGPRVRAAYDAQGVPTQAAQGFARSQKVAVEELVRFDADAGPKNDGHVGVVRHVEGRSAFEVLAEILPLLVTGLRAEKNMRWAAPGLSFSRPVRWLLALLGDVVVPFTVSSLVSGRCTNVHRSAPTAVLTVPCADKLLELLRAHDIIPGMDERRRLILSEAQRLAAQAGGVLEAESETSLLDEVANLVEQPTPILGRFDVCYLDLPDPVLITVMRKHQRYLPVRNSDGGLLAFFVAVANGKCDEEKVRAGNEAVLRARYEDAAFFWRADRKTPLEKMKADLPSLMFEERLGSMADRAGRLAALAEDFSLQIDLAPAEKAVLARAGALAKFDLASQMVVELSSLAGVMAREYALGAGESPRVAQALFEMELPRQAGDALPESLPGALLALADRFDLIAGLFAVEAVPTGSSDPFGLRRAALGVVSILRAFPELSALRLEMCLAAAAALQPVSLASAQAEIACEFIVRRYEQQLLDAGHNHKLVRSVLGMATMPGCADAALQELEKRQEDPDFLALSQAVQRIRRLVPADTSPVYDPSLFVEQAERDLDQTLIQVRAALSGTVSSLDEPLRLSVFVEVAQALIVPIEKYFVDVLVMADDPAVRRNRLRHLGSIRCLADPVLDWDALS